ncbi:MAG TPA: ABC transporter substrate-binding protein [Burkholderiales bacterium]|nr:ABC transporter substrate-binding protein [Burkholderiales bacterium]
MHRRAFVGLVGATVLASPRALFAQAPGKIVRVGFLVPTTRKGYAPRIDGLKAGLRELGYVEGKNLLIEYRSVEDDRYDRLPDLAAQLIALKVDVLVTGGTPATLALKRATSSIPIVIGSASDPVATGLVPNLARPGGNITGRTFFTAELGVKRLQLIREALPQLKRVAVLMNADNVSMVPVEREMAPAAKGLGLEMQRYDVRSPSDFDASFAAMAAKGAEALIVVEDAMLNVNSQRVGAIATERRLVSIGSPDVAIGGGAFAYGVDQVDMFRRAAHYIDKIAKGAKAGELPIERVTKFEMIINMKTIKALGIALPQHLLIRADRVIE